MTLNQVKAVASFLREQFPTLDHLQSLGMAVVILEEAEANP